MGSGTADAPHSSGCPGGAGGNGSGFWGDAEFPSFLVNMLGLRDEREQLSDPGFIRTGSAGTKGRAGPRRGTGGGHRDDPAPERQHGVRRGCCAGGRAGGLGGDRTEARGSWEHPAPGAEGRRPQRAQVGTRHRALPCSCSKAAPREQWHGRGDKPRALGTSPSLLNASLPPCFISLTPMTLPGPVRSPGRNTPSPSGAGSSAKGSGEDPSHVVLDFIFPC